MFRHKTTFFTLLIVLISTSLPAFADESFDQQFAAMQAKIAATQAQVNGSLSVNNQPAQPNVNTTLPLNSAPSNPSINTNNGIDVSGLKTTLPKMKPLKITGGNSAGQLSAFPSTCAGVYMAAMGGKIIHVSGCEPCVDAGLAASNQLNSALDPSLTSVIVDSTDPNVTPMEWSSLTEFQQNIILAQNPSIKLALAASKKQKNGIASCISNTTQASDTQGKALDYLGK